MPKQKPNEQVQQIPLSEIRPFKNHPFKVTDDELILKPENYLKNAEMAMEDDYGMIDGVINNGPKQTVAELEEQAKSGKPVSLMELAQAARQEKKPSVLAKLCPPVNEPKKTARSKRAERELL